jgi:sulfite exporter TauE/SafE
MLSSIHPLGERARNNRWAVTALAFTAGAVVSGAAVGLALGGAGSLLLDMTPTTLLLATAVVALTAGALDLVSLKAPGPARQVNETWIGSFRGWVYGGAFGLELGLGVFTYVVTWGVYAALASALLTASPLAGALVGATFGIGRSLSVLAAGYVDRPSRLVSFNRALARAGPMVRTGASTAFTTLGLVAIAGGLI